MLGVDGRIVTHLGKRTFARHAVATQVVANGAGAAAGVLRGGKAELRASSVVYLAWVSPWAPSTTNRRQVMRGGKCMCLACVLPDCIFIRSPFWPSLSYTFMWTTPLVLFLSTTRFRPSLLVTVPSCADSSSAHHSLPPVNHQCHLLRITRPDLVSAQDCTAKSGTFLFFTRGSFCTFFFFLNPEQIMLWFKHAFENIQHNHVHYPFQVQMAYFSFHSNPPRLALSCREAP